MAQVWSVIAGMPVFRINDVVEFRIQTLSFFLFCFFVCAFFVKLLWNYLQKDFTSLPRLSYKKSVGLTLLVGVLFMCVLTMISGARELMTPGAWKKDGATYALTTGKPADETMLLRRAKLERLWRALDAYAKEHDGRFPPHEFVKEIPPEHWLANADGARFIYFAGLETKKLTEPKFLAYEPGAINAERWVLMTDGTVLQLPLAEIQKRVALPAKQTAAGSPQ
jgi:hypothetical protein